MLRDLVSTTGDLAALPTTVVRLLDLLKDQTCAADKVAQVLDQDGAMTANVLKLSNSAFYGVRGTVGTTRQALVLLGNRAVLTLAFATGMVPVMRRNLTGYGIDRDRYWEHALTSAMTAGVVMSELGAPERSCEAFTAGLVHDIGMLALDSHLATNGMKLVPAFPLFNVNERERETLGFDHTDAGALLAENWGFPAPLAAAIRYHHRPGRRRTTRTWCWRSWWATWSRRWPVITCSRKPGPRNSIILRLGALMLIICACSSTR
ncbi:MAG: HDOD domain-containing protein [bacterium]|nr:HDOD domain-containing protein [bacterium]